MAGYWGNEERTNFVKCLPSSACLGGPKGACAIGYEGDHCGWCDVPDYWRFQDKCLGEFC
jgi:hypothetical protein